MAAIIFSVWILVWVSFLQVCSGDSSECYKIDGAKDVSPKGIYVGYIQANNQTVGSIQFINTTGSKCVCRFPGSHYSIQNVTYYGDKEIPKIESLFHSGCRIIKGESLEKPGYSCSINVTADNQKNKVTCSNIVTATATSPAYSTTIETTTQRSTSPANKVTSATTSSERSTRPRYTASSSESTAELTTSPQQTSTTTSTARPSTTLASDHSSSHRPSTKAKSTPKPVSISLSTLSSKTTNRPTSSLSVSTTPVKVTHNKQSTYTVPTTKIYTTTSSASVVTVVTSDHNKNNPSTSSEKMTSSNIRPSVQSGGSHTVRPNRGPIETTTKKTAKSNGELKLEIIIPVVLAIVFIIFIIAVFICIRKQREKKRIFKYEVSPTPSMRSHDHKESDKEEILQYNSDFYREHGTKHNILYEGEDYCEHGIFNKAFIDTDPDATERKKEDRVYAPTLEGGYSAQPDDLALEEE